MPNLLESRIGGIPLPIIVAGGAGAVFLLFLVTNRNNGKAGQSTGVNMLSPTESEAFGTLQQQQQDVTNALGQNALATSALGGSLNTLTGLVGNQIATENQQYAATSKQGLDMWTSLSEGLRGVRDQVLSGQQQSMGNFTYLFAGPSDPRIQDWQKQAAESALSASKGMGALISNAAQYRPIAQVSTP